MSWTPEVITASGAPAPRGPTSAHAVRVGPLLFVTGQSGRRPGEDAYLVDAREHARQTMENVKAIVEAGGSRMDLVVKRTIVARDFDLYRQVIDVIESYFPRPVASTSLRGGLMLEDMLLEVEVVAAVAGADDAH
ncbi:MAG: hypothetical protein JO352_14295 [Chloroflexi bacterium]|nr:hypothetical protein [Chloroflexota bacterium]MBV9600863.1 hypothetical protein [Chloroflexota bacterium]